MIASRSSANRLEDDLQYRYGTAAFELMPVGDRNALSPLESRLASRSQCSFSVLAQDIGTMGLFLDRRLPQKLTLQLNRKPCRTSG